MLKHMLYMVLPRSGLMPPSLNTTGATDDRNERRLEESRASEENSIKAATVIADYDRSHWVSTPSCRWRCGRVRLFAAILISQTALWIETAARLLSQIRAQVNHIEQMVALQGARP